MLSLLSLIGIGEFRQDSEDERRQSALVYSAVIGVMLLAYGVAFLVGGNPRLRVQGWAQVVQALVLMASVRLLAVHPRTTSRALAWVVVVGAILICMTLAAMGGYTGDAVFWTFPLPFLVFLLLGQRTGWLLNLGYTVGVPALLLGTASLPGFWPYAPTRVVWYGMAYFFNVLAAASFNLLRTNFKARLQVLVDRNTAEARRHLETLRFNAVHDVPSGLLNREGLLDALRAPADPAPRLMVACLRFDRVADLAQIVGMATVDEALRGVGDRLALRCPGEVEVARISPDELAVAFRNPSAGDRVRVLRETLEPGGEAGDAGGYSISNEYTIGYAVSLDAAESASELLGRAERALRFALRRGTRLQEYDRPLDEQLVRHHTRYERLRRLLQAGEPRDGALQLHYQPLVRLDTAAVVGAEALARWTDAEEGGVPPDQFIPIIEGSGLLNPFTVFTVRRAVLDCAAWQRDFPGLWVSVNLSPEALVEAPVIDALEAVVREARLDPALVRVEVTESALMRNPTVALAMMERLVRAGMRLAIDDYGSGYSSLSYLRLLPAHALKIDKAFVRSLAEGRRGGAIVESTIALAHELGMAVVAEGVETADAERRLRELGCDLAQGWHYARALPPSAFITWVRGRHAA